MKKTLLLTILLVFSLGLSAQVPPNDNCEDAINVTEGETVSFSTIDATTDGPFHTDVSCQSSDNDTIFADIWYRFTPTFTGKADWSLCGTTDYDSKVAVYAAGTTCPAQDADLIACNDDFGSCAGSSSRILFDVAAGETYLLRLGGWGETAPGESGSGTFTIGEFTSVLPNDFCEFANEVFLGEDQQFTNIGATTDGPDHPNNSACFGFNDPTVQADIWFSFTSPITGTVEWSTCDQITFDSRLAVYQAGATCPLEDGNLLVCNDDGAGCTGYTSRVSFNAEEGETYLLRLGGYSGEQGSGFFDLVEIVPPVPPANDLCAVPDSAWIVTGQQADDFDGGIEGTTINATFNPDSYLYPNGQCLQNTASGEFADVWYWFNTYGNTELEFRFYKSSDTPTASYYVEMFNACDMQVDTNVVAGSCIFVGEGDVQASTTVTNLPPDPTLYLLRISTHVTYYLPGNYFFFIVGEKTEPPVGTHEEFPGNFQIFPNPAGDKLYLNLLLDETAPTTFTVLNPLGQLMIIEQKGTLRRGAHQFELSVGELPKGIYFFVVRSEQYQRTVRFVKG